MTVGLKVRNSDQLRLTGLPGVLARLLARLVVAAEHAELLARHRLRSLRGATTARTADCAGTVAPAGSADRASTAGADSTRPGQGGAP